MTLEDEPAVQAAPPTRAPAPPRAWQLVLESVEADLLEGRRGPGDHLPPERELATTLGVGRSSVREALRVLEVMGLIRTGTGSGPTSGAIIIATPAGGMATLLRLQLAAQAFPLSDVVRTRLLLESAAVSELAAAGDSRDLEAALQVLDAMEVDPLTPDEFLALDAQFHLAMAEASGNQVLGVMMAGLRSAIENYVRQVAGDLDDWDATAARLRGEHRAIIAAVEGGDARAAVDGLRAHITGYYDQALPRE